MELSERIIEYRARHSMTQIEFAKKCQVSTQTISNIENGRALPSRLTQAKIELTLEEK